MQVLQQVIHGIIDRVVMGKLQPSGTPGRPTVAVPPAPFARPAPEPEPWTACDKCGLSSDGQPISMAKYRVYVTLSSLYFCGHCLTELGPIILEKGYYFREMAYASA